MNSAFRLDDGGTLHCLAWGKFSWLAHGFGTRVSAPPALPLATARQIHSTRVIEVDGSDSVIEDGDALISARPGLAVGVKTADCMPLLLVDPVRRAVAAVHAGWRGTAGEISARTVERMRTDFGSNPAELLAAIGPGIGPCCFEVGPEVAIEFAAWNARLHHPGAKEHLDLESANFEQLRACGLPSGQIYRSRACTMCRTERFFSYRKEGEAAGRMLSWIAVLES